MEDAASARSSASSSGEDSDERASQQALSLQPQHERSSTVATGSPAAGHPGHDTGGDTAARTPELPSSANAEAPVDHSESATPPLRAREMPAASTPTRRADARAVTARTPSPRSPDTLAAGAPTTVRTPQPRSSSDLSAAGGEDSPLSPLPPLSLPSAKTLVSDIDDDEEDFEAVERHAIASREAAIAHAQMRSAPQLEMQFQTPCSSAAGVGCAFELDATGMTTFVALRVCMVRRECSLDSEAIGIIEPGQFVKAAEVRPTPSLGVPLSRCFSPLAGGGRDRERRRRCARCRTPASGCASHAA